MLPQLKARDQESHPTKKGEELIAQTQSSLLPGGDCQYGFEKEFQYADC
jgi:hypothetical protein